MSFIPWLTHKHVWHDDTKTHYLHLIQPESFYQQWLGFPGLYQDEVAIRLRCKDAFYHLVTQGSGHVFCITSSRVFSPAISISTTLRKGDNGSSISQFRRDSSSRIALLSNPQPLSASGHLRQSAPEESTSTLVLQFRLSGISRGCRKSPHPRKIG